MKVFNFVSQVFFLLVTLLFLIYFLTGYDSAFEADQYCHSYLASYDNLSGSFGCDHDTETHKWILYESNDKKEPAKVVQIFINQIFYRRNLHIKLKLLL